LLDLFEETKSDEEAFANSNLEQKRKWRDAALNKLQEMHDKRICELVRSWICPTVVYV
jgi:hypothetical protein